MKQIVLSTAAFILMAASLLVLAACNSGTPAKSSSTDITGLELTIDGTPYPITFNGTAGQAVIAYGADKTGTITVSKVTLPAGATGLAKGDTLTLNSGAAEITITAEDGTTAVYTITVVKEIDAAELPRAAAVVNGITPDNYRLNFGAFSLSAFGTDKGDYRFAVQTKADVDTNGVPLASAIRSASASVVYTLGETPINIFMSFHMDTTLFNAASDWTDTTTGGLAESGVSLKEASVTDAMLAANTEYILLAVDEDDTANEQVYKLVDFKTDPVPAALNTNAFYNMPSYYTFTIRDDQPLLIPAIFGNTLSNNIMKVEGLFIISNVASITPIRASGTQTIMRVVANPVRLAILEKENSLVDSQSPLKVTFQNVHVLLPFKIQSP